MVAIVMTNDGPEVDPLDGVPVHPAAELFPPIPEAEFEALVADIAAHGLREPVVMTPDGRLLDGRSRWRACVRLGDTPVWRVESGDPWAYAITEGVAPRGLTESQRAMVGAKIMERNARRAFGGVRRSPGRQDKTPPADPDRLPTQARIADLLGVSAASVSRGRNVLRHGVPALRDVVEQGHIPVFPAYRVTREIPPDEQDEFVQRVRDGADPTRLLNTWSSASHIPGTPARTDNRSPDRHRHVTTPALRSLNDSLDALRIVLGSTDGLDPAITPEEAARWLDGLSKGRRALYGVVKLLTQRKESTQ